MRRDIEIGMVIHRRMEIFLIMCFHTLGFTASSIRDIEVIEYTSPAFLTRCPSSKRILSLYCLPLRYLFPQTSSYTNVIILCSNASNYVDIHLQLKS